MTDMHDTLAADSPRIHYEKRDRVAWVTINRPALNALDLATHDELRAVWDDFEHDDSLWVAVLTGSGQRAFSVGQDLKELARRLHAGAPSGTFGSSGMLGWPRLTERFSLSKPVVARVNGLALGGGFELALACDIVVSVDRAEFALPEARLGLIAGAGGVFRLARQLPLKTAMGHLLTGRRMSAARAFDLGLINDVVPVAELDAYTQRWIDDILPCAPLSVRAIKEVVTRSSTWSLEQAFSAHYDWEAKRCQSEDSREGPTAFVEKRTPRWSGT